MVFDYGALWTMEQRYVFEGWSAEIRSVGALKCYEKMAKALERCYPWIRTIIQCSYVI